jgi:hypothetical protein
MPHVGIRAGGSGQPLSLPRPMFAFGEGGAKRTMAGVIFGVGMAVGAVNFMSWLFP